MTENGADMGSVGGNTRDMTALWPAFTAERAYRKAPRLLARAKGMYYEDPDGRRILDGTSGLWCVNAGHTRDPIVAAIARQAAELDYAPQFQMGHPLAFDFAARLRELAGGAFGQVFFTNSGSESVDTALKIARAYHQARGEGGRFRLIGRERGYHGVNLGGTSVGGIVTNRKAFGPLLPGVDHMRHTHDPARNAFSVGEPPHGAELADDLEKLVTLHDASTIAAVIVEPVAGSTGVLPPPVGYLKRLREICDRHGILLIFDEVITGFGRLGSPFAFQRFGVVPDIMTTAKGLTNGAVPMGAVFVRSHVHDAFMTGPEGAIELFHGYTYSGHPLACAAGMAMLDVCEAEGLLTRAAELEKGWADAFMGLKGTRHVIDVRPIGLVAGIELEPRPGAPGRRAFEVFQRCFDEGVLIRTTGDTIALSPPLIIEDDQVSRLVETVATAIAAVE